mmetsp:Transcript_29021/g.76074  ORF Transcript_29021/g.76074 Transcript_29021/m.76074 type:complete len:207 (-) Transcript_29021:2084-2704(-)
MAPSAINFARLSENEVLLFDAASMRVSKWRRLAACAASAGRATESVGTPALPTSRRTKASSLRRRRRDALGDGVTTAHASGSAMASSEHSLRNHVGHSCGKTWRVRGMCDAAPSSDVATLAIFARTCCHAVRRQCTLATLDAESRPASALRMNTLGSSWRGMVSGRGVESKTRCRKSIRSWQAEAFSERHSASFATSRTARPQEFS